jgi:putative MATE family efflux protein
MLRLALPVLIEQFLGMLVVWSDALLTGHYLGERHLAAMSALLYVMWMVPSLYALVAIGATALVARFVGGGQNEQARRVAHQTLLLGIGWTAGIMVVLWTLAGPLLERFAPTAESAELAARYLRFVICVLPAVMLTQLGPACLRGAGDTVSGMGTMAIVNAINIVASWALCRGWWGLPELGWDGLAIGTALGYAVGGLIMLGLLVRGRSGLKLSRRLFRWDADLVRRLLRIGIPGGSDVLTVIVCHFWFAAIVFRLGETAGAAHGVALRIESLAYLPGSAFQVAAATMAGQFLGAGDNRRAGRSVLLASLVCGGLMGTAGVLFFAAADPLVRLFVSQANNAVVAQAIPLLRIVAFGMPALAILMVLTGALRGAGDTRWPMVFNWIGMLGVRIPGTYLLTHVVLLGVTGAWYAMVTDLVVRCLLVCWRFGHGGWKHVKV